MSILGILGNGWILTGIIVAILAVAWGVFRYTAWQKFQKEFEGLEPVKPEKPPSTTSSQLPAIPKVDSKGITDCSTVQRQSAQKKHNDYPRNNIRIPIPEYAPELPPVIASIAPPPFFAPIDVPKRVILTAEEVQREWHSLMYNTPILQRNYSITQKYLDSIRIKWTTELTKLELTDNNMVTLFLDESSRDHIILTVPLSLYPELNRLKEKDRIIVSGKLISFRFDTGYNSYSIDLDKLYFPPSI